jgi:RimJ/RimL family protein N-acetyltransferase
MSSPLARDATESDAELLLGWRNDPRTRSASRSNGVIALADHLAWLGGVLASPDRLLLVVELGGEPVGTVRFDRLAAVDTWEVSITVAPGQRGQGLSGAILTEGERILTQRHRVRRIVAGIHRANAASAALFHRAGYVEAEDGAPAAGEFRQLSKRPTTER